MDQLIFYKGKIFIHHTNTSLVQTLLAEFHSSPLGGHSGVRKTIKRIKQVFFWKHMKRTVEEYIQQCDNCQRAKSENILSPGLLQPLPIPETIWTDITMDFITHLPKSHNYTVIYVVVDRLTKYAHFFPLQHPYTAKQVAQVFFDGIFKLYGLPKSIISTEIPYF